jgi:hypothetical protein
MLVFSEQGWHYSGMKIFREYPEIRGFPAISGVFQSGSRVFPIRAKKG